MCKIKEILQKKGPYFNIVTPNTKVTDALTLMQTENISYVVVMENDSFLGIMTERDYIYNRKALQPSPETAVVKSVVKNNLPIVSYDEDLNRCMVLMNVYKTRYLPVYDEMEFKGILTMADVLKEILDEKDITELPPL
jgi:CBS domain-containing protein